MRNHAFFAICLVWVLSGNVMGKEPEPFLGEVTSWHGFDQHEFEVAGKKVFVVSPKVAAPGRPWVWHGEFFGHKPDPDIALLKRGFFIAYMQIPNMLGSPEAVNYWNQFYQEATERYQLGPKVALVGLSRGGLYCYNWAEANPEKVACIYGDAPVCDFKSWPGGKGKGPGSEKDWKLVLERYGFNDEAEAVAYKLNPIDNLAPLAKHHVPLLHVYGDADEVVPWEENTGILAERYRALGGDVTLIAKPGVKHHPHGLDDSTPIVNFIEKHARIKPVYTPMPAVDFQKRGGLGNFFAKLKQGGPVRIAYLGGSITAANGWRVKSREWFAREYPNAQISEIHAAIGGTGSDLGVFRVGHDALQHQPDLLFVEFAVNDGGAAPDQIWRNMEGIVRQTWKKNPRTDICFVYTYRTGFEKDVGAGNCPQSASAMEMLAEHYSIPSINFNKEVVALQAAGKLVYQSAEPTSEGVIRFSTDGVHPLDEGHQIYQDVLAKAMKQIEAESAPIDHSSQLDIPYVVDNLEAAKMVPVTRAMLSEEWKELPPDAPLSKSFSGRMGSLWEATKPGSRIHFKFRGSIAKVYDLVGPDGGQVIVTVDGKSSGKPIPRFDRYCTYHRIATLQVAHDVDPNLVHDVVIELHPDQPDRSILKPSLKNPEEELKQPKYQGTNIRVGQILVLGDLVPGDTQ